MKKLLVITLLVCLTFTPSLAQQNYYDVTPGNGYGLRLWSSDNYKIDMGNGANYNYGPVTDYSMKFNMSLNAGRGWTWGSWGVPVAGLSIDGTMKIAGTFTSLKLNTSATGGSIDAGNIPESGDIIIKSYTGGRSATTGAQLEFVIPANTDGSNFWGQGRIITVAGNGASGSATGKMILGTRRYYNKLGAGMMWYYGDDLTIDGSGNVGIGTSSPGIWFPSKVFEISDLRPVLKLTSTDPASLSTITFTNSSVNTSTRNGEFHINYKFDQTNNEKSAIRFSGYPVGEIFAIQADGKVGVGTISPRSPLEVSVAGNNSSVQTGLIIQQTNPASPNNAAGISLDFGIGNNGVNNNILGKITLKETYWSTKPKMFFSLWDANNVMQDRMVIDFDGNVGIGTTSLDAKLTVKGDIHTREVKVDLNGAVGPDYVFEKDYDLLSLTELETYITQHKHLPEVPSAKEMEANGLNLKEMNLLLLKKVEELTLHLIEHEQKFVEQNKTLEALRQKSLEQQKEIELLKSR